MCDFISNNFRENKQQQLKKSHLNQNFSDYIQNKYKELTEKQHANKYSCIYTYTFGFGSSPFFLCPKCNRKM